MSFRNRILGLCCALLLLIAAGVPVHAESKQAYLVTTDKQEDLVVNFSFDTEIVPIVFLSPSGARFSQADGNVEYAEGDLWSTYRIADAEAGDWSVEYDIGRNSVIDYSILDENNGLWLQYVKVQKKSQDTVTVSFEADNEDGVYYSYDIQAIRVDDSSEVSTLVNGGGAEANQPVETDVSVAGLPGADYIFRVQVSYNDGDAVVSDSMDSDTFHYENQNPDAQLSDFTIAVDETSLNALVDWSSFSGSFDTVRVKASSDGEEIFNSDFQYDVSNQYIAFPEGTKNLVFTLEGKRNGSWAASGTRSITLGEEYLTTTGEDSTGSAQITLAYKTAKERTLHVTVNERSGDYTISGEGTLAFDLSEGQNEITASFDSENGISYRIDKEIYYDTTAPTIRLSEDLDGKTFATDTITIIGTTSGTSTLTVNGTEVPLGSDGSFSTDVKLANGENIVTLEASDAGGNATAMVLTLYSTAKGAGGSGSGGSGEDDSAAGGSEAGASGEAGTGTGSVTVETQPLWKQFLPMIAAGIASVVIIILSALFMKKRGKNPDGTRPTASFVLFDILIGIIDGGLIFLFVRKFLFARSMKFLELAERSATEAAAEMKMLRILGIASLVGLAVLAAGIAVTIIVKHGNKKRRAAQQAGTSQPGTQQPEQR